MHERKELKASCSRKERYISGHLGLCLCAVGRSVRLKKKAQNLFVPSSSLSIFDLCVDWSEGGSNKYTEGMGKNTKKSQEKLAESERKAENIWPFVGNRKQGSRFRKWPPSDDFLCPRSRPCCPNSGLHFELMRYGRCCKFASLFRLSEMIISTFSNGERAIQNTGTIVGYNSYVAFFEIRPILTNFVRKRQKGAAMHPRIDSILNLFRGWLFENIRQFGTNYVLKAQSSLISRLFLACLNFPN